MTSIIKNDFQLANIKDRAEAIRHAIADCKRLRDDWLAYGVSPILFKKGFESMETELAALDVEIAEYEEGKAKKNG